MRKLFILLCLPLFSCDSEPNEEFIPEIIAEAELFSVEAQGDDQYTILETRIGTATFGQYQDMVRLTITLEGMTPNTEKAVHIHNGSLEDPGRHWNQGYLFAACDSVSLGRRWDKPFLGDVGNVSIDSEGNGEFVLTTDLWRINSGDSDDVLQKIIIIHEEPQDFSNECTPFHVHDHSNEKIAGGVIKLISDIQEKAQLVVKMEQVPEFLICK